MMDTRKSEEREFHDRLRTEKFGQRWSPEIEETLEGNNLWSNMKYYSIERRSRKLVLEWFKLYSPGKKLLDYCCGNGEDALVAARAGAREVIGIDLSDVSIANCKLRAQVEGLDGLARFQVMDAERLDFPDNRFDIVTEYGALHHLDLTKAYAEIARVLKPNGNCICTETLGHNPIIHHYRRKTPDLRTEWEVNHILRKKDIERARGLFDQVRILGFFHLASLAAVPFRRMRGFNTLLWLLESVDACLLRLPVLKWQAWQVVFILSGPKK